MTVAVRKSRPHPFYSAVLPAIEAAFGTDGCVVEGPEGFDCDWTLPGGYVVGYVPLHPFCLAPLFYRARTLGAVHVFGVSVPETNAAWFKALRDLPRTFVWTPGPLPLVVFYSGPDPDRFGDAMAKVGDTFIRMDA